MNEKKKKTEQHSPAPVAAGKAEPAPMKTAPLAYENEKFLNSADGRLIRIVSEYLEPLARFRREQIQDTVVFFGSARFRGREEADPRAGTAGEHRLRASPRPATSSPPSRRRSPPARRPSCN